MRTKHLSFELEQTAHGTFLLQGLLGGILAGFIYTVAIAVWDQPHQLAEALFILVVYCILASVLGVLKSIIMWAPYRLTKIRVRAATRVVITSFATGAFALSIALLAGTRRQQDLITWTLTLLIGGLPTAILVGSRIKPWELFTFGSIAGQRHRSVLGTLGTLPLRFLSLLTLPVYGLYFVWYLKVNEWSAESILVIVAIASYLLFSAYVSFKSPAGMILLIAGLGVNIAIALIGFAYVIQFNVQRVSEAPWYVSAICILLVIAWAIFLIARLSVQTRAVRVPLGTLTTVPIHIDRTDHHCLGSRFVEWQKHVA